MSEPQYPSQQQYPPYDPPEQPTQASQPQDPFYSTPGQQGQVSPPYPAQYPPTYYPPAYYPPSSRNRRGLFIGLGVGGGIVLLILTVLAVVLGTAQTLPSGISSNSNPSTFFPPAAIAADTPTAELPAAIPTTPAPSTPALPVSILPYNYQQQDTGDGWKVGTLNLYFVNNSNQPVAPQELMVTDAEVNTKEQKSYPAGVISHDNGGFGGPDIQDGAYAQFFPADFNLHDNSDSTLGIPTHFPFRYTNGGIWWEVRFRYAAAATPVSVSLQLDQYGQVNLNLSAVPVNFPAPSADQVHAHPLSDLTSSMSVDNAQLKFSWDGGCGYRLENLVENKMIYMPFTVVNKDKLDEQDMNIKFPYAIYRQDGSMSYSDATSTGAIGAAVGPGQTVHDLFLLDLLIDASDPMPSYLLRYNDDGSITTYQLDCSQPIATGTPAP